MRLTNYLSLAAVLLTAGATLSSLAASAPAGFVYETDKEFISTGDFNGDGKVDFVIVDRDTGRVRIGYQAANSFFDWANYIDTGVKDVSSATVGRLFAEGKDSVALASADGNAMAIIEVAKPGDAGIKVTAPPPGLGPNCVVAIDIGGAGNTPLADLFLNTTYNSPTPNQAFMLRNTAGKFEKAAAQDMPGAVTRGNRLVGAGPNVFLSAIVSGDQGDVFQVATLASGKLETVTTLKEVPAGSVYVVGNFGGAQRLILYTPGENAMTARTITQNGAAVALGEAKSFTVEKPLKSLFVVPADGSDKLVATFGTNEAGAVLFFDGAAAPTTLLALTPANGELLNGAAAYQNSLVVFFAPAIGKIKYSTRYQQYALTATACTPGARGGLPSLADTDDATVPDIHKLILSKLTEKAEADMKPYTNTIPGTTVKYSMVPIPGGEFVMGSPASEKGRKEDEGPQHKVKIEPFWMEQFEISWSEYELFMYRDEERKFKDTMPTDPNVDKVSDAVTRPSKPYVEMSFGMGKDGYPAIAMTHHAANKYCHWLSAKTGHFYRLPTEAEWEYACRAGTTTAYNFGDDASKLKDYAWFEDNSDFKYQKIGKKKPNPWGLYDMHGNVTEWCLDAYDATFYGKSGNTVVVEPWNKATQPYPHVVRGGSWDEPVAASRSAARRGSDRAWKQQDPQLPKSIWWLSDAQWVGFRPIRPLKVPPPAEMVKCWTSGTEKD
jgi:formylglycine-generating enzyme required for sulfatase activity